MSFRCIGLACAISLMMMGCTHFATADTPKTRALWRTQLARQQLAKFIFSEVIQDGFLAVL
jgi:hypothetical protein